MIDIRKFIIRKGLFTRLPIPPDLRTLEPEINLGRAILDKAVLDSLDDPDVRLWFDEEDEDFCDICYISAMEPFKVVEYYSNVMSKYGKQ